MTKKENLIRNFLKNPAGLRYSQIRKVLQHYGFFIVPARGSHVKFKHDRLNFDLVIPVHKGECKDFYKKMALKYIRLLHQ